MFEALGSFTYRRRWLVLALTGLFLLGSLVMLMRGGTLTSGTIRDIESTRAEHLVAQVSGHPPQTALVAIFRSASPATLDPRGEPFRASMRRALDGVRHDPAVQSVTGPEDAISVMAAEMVDVDAHAAFAIIVLTGDVKTALRNYPKLREKLLAEGLEITCTGHVPFMHDLDTTLERDLVRAEIISLPLALLVLLLVFRTAVAAILPVGVGALAVVGGVAIVMALSHVTDMAQYTINVCSLIGLGVAVDYSLFTVSRYREELAAGHDYEQALVRAVGKVGRVVAFSGGAVGTGLAGLLFFDGSYLLAMGLGGAIVVALAVIFALTFLPALLAVLGPRIHAGKLPTFRLGPGEGFFHRLAGGVMRRPLLVLIPTLGVLLTMGVPFLHLQMAATDVNVLDGSSEARRGIDELRRDFSHAAQTRITVAVEFPAGSALTRERLSALYDFTHRVADLPGVAEVESLVDVGLPISKARIVDGLLDPPKAFRDVVEAGKRLTTKDRVTLVNVVTNLAPNTDAARDLVRAIRKDRSVGDGTIVVGGEIAADLDATAFMRSRAPRAIAFVVSVTLIVLFLLFGSVVLPIKAVVMNFVSIAGSFGALVWVFQDGHLFVREGRPIEPTLPVLLFCALFGMSMDYEVLMLSRIKESWERTHDNTHAVGEGLERTAGLITSAAAIMVAVFGAFALARIIVITAVGFSMALAVALDATLVRMLLVPATMRLFGHLNWWAPKWMLRIRSGLGFGHPGEGA